MNDHMIQTCMLSIHNNLSAGTQNVTGVYIIIMLAYKHLLTMHLHGRAAVRYVPNNTQEQQKLFI